MDIKTKYNLYDEFWTLHDNKIKQFPVHEIKVINYLKEMPEGKDAEIRSDIFYISYLTSMQDFVHVKEKEFYQSKSELVANL